MSDEAAAIDQAARDFVLAAGRLAGLLRGPEQMKVWRCVSEITPISQQVYDRMQDGRRG